MRRNRRRITKQKSFLHTRTVALCATVVLLGPSCRRSIISTSPAAATFVSAAAVPPNPGQAFDHHRRQKKLRNRKGGLPKDLLDNKGNRRALSVDLAHPHNAPLKRYRDYARRRLRHLLCAASLPLFALRKAVFDGDIVYRNTARRPRKRPGTRFVLQFPNADVASEMYLNVRFAEKVPFNHDCVGMTRPSGLVPTASSASAPHRKRDGSKKTANDLAGTVSATGDYTLDKYSWPNATISDREAKRRGWRVLRYRKCVGYGQEYYERVRRAVLDWEFATVGREEGLHNESAMRKDRRLGKNRKVKAMGIIRAKDIVAPNFGAGKSDIPHMYLSRTSIGDAGAILCSSRDCATAVSSFNEALSSSAGRSLRVQSIQLNAGGRRMVTYTECRYGIDIRTRLRIGLPVFYAVNPVALVYDIVDERCSNGDTFTSTAYATVGDHLLSGEERVTVALRHSASANERHCPVHVEILSYSRSAPSIVGRIVWPLIGRTQNEFFTAEMDHFQNLRF